jgi:hypothetical protein
MVGTGFAIFEEPSRLPYLILMFKELRAAEDIFAAWHREFGQEDTEERLRVSIITGINSDNPAAYRVIVSVNPDWSGLKEAKGKQVIIVARFNEMTPRTSANLDRFMDRYRKVHQYLLLPGQARHNELGAWAPKLGILKRELIVRPAWQIGRHDPDICGIYADDKIIVPEGATDIPVLEALAWKKKRKGTLASPSPPRGRATTSAPRQKLGRNDLCFCGSGRKYKKCHGR